MRSRIVTVGIAPWGLLRRSEQLIGCDSRICYDRQAGPKYDDDDEYGEDGRLFLNDRHSYFLLVDNGTVDRYGAEIVLRRRLEEFLARKTGNGNGNRIPIICVALEGGLCTLNGIHQFLHGQPPIPVIICEGSGRISDLLAMAEQHLDTEG